MKTTAFRQALCTLLCWCGFLTALPGISASFSLNPTLDTFVTTSPTGNLANNNYGGAGAIAVSAAGSAQGEFQSLLQFNLASAKSSFDGIYGVGQWSITSVTLQLTAATNNNSIFNTSTAGQYSILWQQNDSWAEGTGNPQMPTNNGVTFATLSNYVGAADELLGTFSFSGATSGNVTNGLSLAALFSSEIYSGTNISLRMLAADASVSGIFDSRSFGVAGARPLLTINAIPEPSVWGLAALGLGILQWRRTCRPRSH